MLYIVFTLLALLSRVEASETNSSEPSTEIEIGQTNDQGVLLTPSAYISVLEGKVRTLQRENAELKRTIQTLEPFRQLSILLQKRLTELSEAVENAKGGYEDLRGRFDQLSRKEKEEALELQDSQDQLARDKEQIEKLVKDQEERLAELQRCEELIKNAGAQKEEVIRNAAEQKRALEQALEQEKSQRLNLLQSKNQSERDLQESLKTRDQLVRDIQSLQQQVDSMRQQAEEVKQNANKLNNNYQSVQASLTDCENQLKLARQQILQLRQSQQSSVMESGEESRVLKEKIQSLQRDLDEIKQQNDALSSAKGVAEQQLEDKSKRLNSYEKAYLQSVKESQEMQIRMQVNIDDKAATIQKLNKQISILEAECAAKK